MTQEQQDMIDQQKMFQQASEQSQHIAAIEQDLADKKNAKRSQVPVYIQEVEAMQRQIRERNEKIDAKHEGRMSTVAEVTPEIAATHADRPSAKRQLRMRIVPVLIGGKDRRQIEFKFHHPIGNGQSVELTQFLPIHEPDPRLVIPPLHVLGSYVEELMQQFWAKEAEVDGLLAKIDALTTDGLMKAREIESLEAKLAEMTRQRDAAKANKNGKRE